MSTSSARQPASREIAGRATAQGTRRYAERYRAAFATDFYRPFGGDDLCVASLGLGTYLGEPTAEDDARYGATAKSALARGINVIDTAINYRCQRSERAIGKALSLAINRTALRRDEIVVSSKGGYIPLDGAPPESREDYAAYIRSEYIDAGLLSADDIVAGGHAIAPAYLADQIARSRANLGLRTIDLYYVHNPEQQLDAISPELFRERLRAAFEMLEEKCAAGEIGRYGCATWNGLRTPPGERGHLGLADLVAIATEVAGASHHFRAVQLPINLAMNEAVRLPTQPLPSGAVVSLLQCAAELGVSVVASATLLQAKLANGLPPQLGEALPGLSTDAQRAIAFVRSLPVVSTALVGMRSDAHLGENLEAGRA
ncbi:MAG: aldo/keto reductase [Gemmatimonadota bacterium]|nr:aldo/keto reductase [Gemmatimonadota bacterium]